MHTMKKNAPLLQTACLAALLGTAAAAYGATRPDGQALYAKYCSACHRDPSQLTQSAAVVELLRNPPGSMPFFSEEKLPDKAAIAIRAYLLSLSGVVLEENEPLPPAASKPVNPAFEVTQEQSILSLKPRKKVSLRNFVRKWTLREDGKPDIAETFEIVQKQTGELRFIPPTKMHEKAVTISRFDISDNTLRLQMKWKMVNARTYWKIDTYELRLSEDGKKLSGTHEVDTPRGNHSVRNVLGE